MESKMDKLRMRWARSDYEILLEKVEMLKSSQEEKDENGVKESLGDVGDAVMQVTKGYIL